MKHILLLALSIITLYGSNLDNLLTKYNQETQIHKQTKKEAAGHIIVITRDDLDRMQAYTLNDVLNTIRMFNFQASRNAGTSISFATAKSGTVTPVKLFINNHELNNITFGNPIAQYGAMNLYFVDYIEIYQAGNSVTFGNESGSMIIRLYTKKPKYENATYGEFTIDTRTSTQLNILDAKVIDKNYSYLLNVDINNKNMKKIDYQNYNLSRDYAIGHFFFQFNKKNDYHIEIGATKGKKDLFASFSLHPLKDDLEGENIYLQIDKKLPYNINLKLSSSVEQNSVDYQDMSIVTLTNDINASNIKFHGKTSSLSAILEKHFITKKNDLMLATKIKYNRGSLSYFTVNNSMPLDMIHGPTKFNIYSIYGEDLYNINDNNLITIGLKYDYITDNYKTKPTTSFIYRLGYVYNSKSFTNKLFIFNRMNQPTMGQMSFSPVKVKPNAELGPVKMDIVSGESSYKLNKSTKVGLGLAYAHVKDIITVNPLIMQFVNKKESVEFERFYCNIKHSFDLYNKIAISYYKIYKQHSFSPASGGIIQIFNTIGKIDIYNELVYRASYTNELKKSMQAGYDYTLAIGYKLSRHSTIKIKGENLLNKASKVYIYDDPKKEGISVAARDQRVIMSWEYEF